MGTTTINSTSLDLFILPNDLPMLRAAGNSTNADSMKGWQLYEIINRESVRRAGLYAYAYTNNDKIAICFKIANEIAAPTPHQWMLIKQYALNFVNKIHQTAKQDGFSDDVRLIIIGSGRNAAIVDHVMKNMSADCLMLPIKYDSVPNSVYGADPLVERFQKVLNERELPLAYRNQFERDKQVRQFENLMATQEATKAAALSAQGMFAASNKSSKSQAEPTIANQVSYRK